MATPGAPAARRLRPGAAVVTGRVVRPAALAAAAVLAVALVCGGAGPLLSQTSVADVAFLGQPGYPGAIPEVPVKVNVRDMGARADGTTDDAGAIQRAIDAVDGRGAVLLPAGTYLLRSGVALKSGVVLRGEGKDRTHLIVNAPKATWNGAIGAHGRYVSDEIAIVDGARAGSTRITVADAAGIVPGAVVHIYADNDPGVMYTEPKWNQSWAALAVGQILEVVAIQGTTLMLDAPLRVTFDRRLDPRLRVVAPVSDFGIERLDISRLDQAEDYVISLSLAERGWIRECEVAWATRANIDVALSREITVRSNDIHHARNYGDGGHGYGIAVSRTNDSLFEDNLIYMTRHSLMVSLGSNGNVFAYNYSRDHQVVEPGLADMVIHGHYAHTNLFEGNVGDSLRVADWWGPAPHITLYRNRMRHYIAVHDHSHFVSVVGNTVLDDADIEVKSNVENAFVADNLIAGKLPDGDLAGSLPPSLWRAQPPPYWGGRPWPCTGADVDRKVPLCRIPAQDRDPGPAVEVAQPASSNAR